MYGYVCVVFGTQRLGQTRRGVRGDGTGPEGATRNARMAGEQEEGAARAGPEPGLHPGSPKGKREAKGKEEGTQQALSERDMDRDPPLGTVRARTDGSEQEAVDGQPYTGYGLWFGQ